MKIHYRPRGARKQSLAQKKGSSDDGIATRHGYFKSFDGTRLFYSIEGEGQPLIFCYGLVCSSLHWTYQIEHFKRGYQTIWMDYRGHQNSELPEDLSSLTLESLARDLECLMNELGLKQAVMLGHSMGVNVVLEFARRYPDRLRGMVLANGTANRPLETLLNGNTLEPGFAFLEMLEKRSPRLLNMIWKTQKANPLVQRMIGLLGFNPYLTPKEDVRLYVDQIAELDPRVFIRLIRDYDHYNASTWLHTILTPTLVMAGEKDLIIPLEQQELLHQLLANSRFELIRHGSHCPQMDLPELVNHKIEAFLKSIEASKES